MTIRYILTEKAIPTQVVRVTVKKSHPFLTGCAVVAGIFFVGLVLGL